MRFRYSMFGERSPPTEILSANEQRQALELLLGALEPDELAIPERTLQIMAPRPFGYQADGRAFRSATGPAFDQIGTARTLASMIVRGILSPQRAARVVAFHDRNPSLPALEHVIERLVERTWLAPAPEQHAALRRVSQRVVLDELMALAANPEASVEVRGAAVWGIEQIQNFLATPVPTDASEEAHRMLARGDIMRFKSRQPRDNGITEALPAPPGTPIGIPR